ncbi:MAG: hypothetical protein JWL84_4705 [Rhodospirillales bacterium]|jgi:hypothetical protein|nr:hypothetical protein [Rhodospirillales bacterium]
MHYSDSTYLLAMMASGTRIRIWTGSIAEAELIAEAFHEARPNWALSIDGLKAVFSREGKIVDLSTPASVPSHAPNTSISLNRDR